LVLNVGIVGSECKISHQVCFIEEKIKTLSQPRGWGELNNKRAEFHFRPEWMTNYSRSVVLLSILELSQELARRLEC